MMPRKRWAVAAYVLLSVPLFAAPQVRAQTEASFDLPSQPLATSLRDVARATHTNIVFNDDAVSGIRAPALTGGKTAEQAVGSLLANTGLRYTRVDARTLRITQADRDGARGQEHGRAARALGGTVSAPVGSQSPERTEASESPASGETAANESSSRVGKEESASPSRVELSEVVVTGSHIHGAINPSPTITISRADIERSGYVDVGNVVRSLPQNFSAGNNPQVYVPNTPTQGDVNIDGGSSPNLRGLGPASTLTLVNGHRLGSDGPVGAPDISLIPVAAIERIDVVTDSSSAAYGSDAVGGVVNFILRKSYEGAETTGTLGTATDGGAYKRDISQLVGHSWGSGSALAVYEHQREDAVWSSQRDFTATAPGPSSLLPGSSRDSGFLTAHQDITDSVSVFADGLYTSRASDNDFTYPAIYGVGTLIASVAVRQYLADAGVSAHLPHDWDASAYASASAQRSNLNNALLPPGASVPIPVTQQLYRGTTRVAELTADGPILDLGTDAVRMALGGGYRQENLDDTGALTLRAKRGVRYAFAELNVPLAAMPAFRTLRTLDVNVSGRYDGYTDAGGKVVPKIGLLAAPIASATFRATWSKAFQAPTLSELDGASSVSALVLPDPLSPTGTSIDLVRGGGNPQLSPETATTWTAGIDWRPIWASGIETELSYFDIRYSGRVQVLNNTATVLEDPVEAPLVTRNPSVALQQEAISESTAGFRNLSGQPYLPADIAALVDGRDVNIAEQHLDGVDLRATYRRPLHSGSLDAFVNGSYMELRQRTTPAAPQQELVGRTFNPPRFRGRGGLTWSTQGWAATAIVNWIGGSIDTYVPGSPPVGSWTTFDMQLSYTAPPRGFLAGLQARLSVQNILDRDPPFVQYAEGVAIGFNYDSNNSSPIGRVVSLQISKEWFPKGDRQ